MIDPPSGWKYGFPKPAPKDHHKEEVLTAWLIEQGYPEDMIELALNYSRYWESEEDLTEYTKGARMDDNYEYFSHQFNALQNIHLDPDHREWEYDGDGKKIYKVEAGFGKKTPWEG